VNTERTSSLHRVYCAGPLFNPSERREMRAIAAVLAAAGFQTFLPHADGMEFAKVLPYLDHNGHERHEAAAVLHKAIFALDAYQVVVGCGSLVCNLNGRVPDEGAVAEATMAWMLGKPVVLFKQDIRTSVSGRDNPLVAGLAEFALAGEFDEMIDSLHRQIETVDRRPDVDAAAQLPPKVRQAVEKGRALWRRMCENAEPLDDAQLAQIVWSLFGPTPAGGCVHS
jgi:nucleoside 2-deoxyribosyltransferase